MNTSFQAVVPRDKIVIIGGGMAGCKLAQTLNDMRLANVHITLISEEQKVGYNRILLSSLLADDVTDSEMAFVDIEQLKNDGVLVINNDPAIDLNQTNKTLQLNSGHVLSYDKLVFATGSRPTNLFKSNAPYANVMGFRTWQDADVLSSLKPKQNVAVVGGGLLGLEAAVGLSKKGHLVTVFHRSAFIMNRQLDEVAAQLLQRRLESMGITFLLGESPTRLTSDASTSHNPQYSQNRVTHIERSNGELMPIDLVIMAAGITPEVSLASQAALDINRAITVNAQMQTSAANIFAIGECCEYEQHTFGLVAPIWAQIKVVSKTLFNQPAEFFTEPVPTKLKVSGIDLFSVGDIHGSEKSKTIYLKDTHAGHYRKLIIDGSQLVGAILYGNVADGMWYAELILKQKNITDLLDRLIFGEAYCEQKAA